MGEKMKEKLTIYRPAAAAFVTMMAMSLTSSTLSFFLEPVCAFLGVGKGSFSLIFSLMTVSGAISNPILGQYAGKKGVRKILLLSGLWVCAMLLLFSTAEQLWMVYLAGFLMGALGTNCVALCANVIVQNAYSGAAASGILGTVMAGSGVGGMIFNMIIPAVMENQGWQAGMRVMALCWLGMLLLAALVLGKETLPNYHKSGPSVGLGMTRAEALKSPELYLVFLVIIVITACCGIQQQQPSLLTSYGFSSERISLLISVQTAVLAVGKIVQGLLYGKLGIRRGGCIMILVFALAFVVLLNPGMVLPGMVLMAFGLGVYTTLMPLVTRNVFGTREYASIWSLIATGGSVGTILVSPLWGMVYDATGSYTLAMTVAPALLVVAALALYALLREKN